MPRTTCIGGLSDDEFRDAIGPLNAVQLIVGLATLATFIVTIIWMYRIATNVRAFQRRTTWSPLFAIFGWMLPPFVLYVIPFLMFRELWKASDSSATRTIPRAGGRAATIRSCGRGSCSTESHRSCCSSSPSGSFIDGGLSTGELGVARRELSTTSVRSRSCRPSSTLAAAGGVDPVREATDRTGTSNSPTNADRRGSIGRLLRASREGRRAQHLGR